MQYGLPHKSRSVLYEKAEPVLLPEGLHLAELIDVRKFGNVFGDRVGLVLRISTGPYAGQEIMEAARCHHHHAGSWPTYSAAWATGSLPC